MNEHSHTGSSDPDASFFESDSSGPSQGSDPQSSSASAFGAGVGAGVGGGAGVGDAPKSKARGRKKVSRRKSSSRRVRGTGGSTESSADEAPQKDDAPQGRGAEDGGRSSAKPARKRKSRRKKAPGRTESSDSEDHRESDARGRSSQAEEDVREPRLEGEAGLDDSGSGKKRRRRGSRGGRRRKKGASEEGADSSSEDDGHGDRPEVDSEKRPKSGRRRSSRASRDGATVDNIPGEEDELPDAPASKRAKAGRSSKKKRSRSRSKDSSNEDENGEAERGSKKKSKRATKKKSTEPERSAEELAAEAEALRTDVIYINACEPEEKRVGVVGSDGRIHDLLMTAESQKTLVNDIYRGRVVNLEPAIGAAFVDFGQGRNGFLHTSDVLPMYGEDGFSLEGLLTASVDPDEWDSSDDESGTAQGDEDDGAHGGSSHEEGHRDWHDHDHGDQDESDDADSKEGSGSRGRSRSKKKTRGKAASSRGKKPKSSKKTSSGKDGSRAPSRRRAHLPISELLKVGDQVVVQITKDAIGDKGPTLTTYISIPGRYLVLMPSMARTGVSRKIPDDKERRRLKRILTSLNAPTEMGVIVRTAGVGKTKTDLQRDLDYLLGVWETFGRRLKAGRGPSALYQESDVAIRTLRDLFNKTTKKVLVDDPGVLEQLNEFATKLMPEHSDRIQGYKGDRPIFHDAGLEQDFEKIFARRVELASGGSIVFDQAEALVAIDVNSGRTRTDSYDFEEVALKTNLEAVPEIARQIRLRDLGGIIVCDFIDMMKSSSNRAVERALRLELAPDRARSKLGRISQFGLLELTRQRLGPGTHKKVFQACPRCRGTARVRTVESRAQAILRRLGSALTQKGFSKVEVRAHPEVVVYLKESLWDYMRALEHRFEKELTLTAVPEQPEDSVLRYLRADGREVRPGGRRKR